jgi:16S rRNA processing protein RimM
VTLPGGRSERPLAWDDLVVVGEALRPHGVHGALLVRPVAPDLSALLSLRRAFLGSDAASVREMTIAATSVSGRFAAIRFEGIDDREAASRLAGLAVLVPATEAAPLPGGRPYLFQLVGLRVESRAGEPLGEIVDVIENPGNDLWVAKGPAGEFLIPAVDNIVLDVDLAARRVVIDPIAGLLPDRSAPPSAGDPPA